MSQNDIPVQDSSTLDDGEKHKIERASARRFFFNYHENESADPPTIQNSQGKLKVRQGSGHISIQHFVLTPEVISKLRNAVEAANYTYQGIAILPATNDEGSDTLILVAIAIGQDNEPFYFLPQNISDESSIYDYIDICPTICDVKNHQKVWGDWTR